MISGGDGVRIWWWFGVGFCRVFIETCVVGAHWNRLGEAILMGAHSMGFCEVNGVIIS